MSSTPSSSAPKSGFKLAPGTFLKPSVTPGSEMDLDSPPDTASDFTPKMRDRQSRGKNPYALDDSSDVDEEVEWRAKHPGMAPANRRPNPPAKGDFGAAERRQKAIAYLDNPELLMMYAQSTGDSMPAARLHFMKMMCGYDKESLAEAQKGPSRSSMDQQQDRDVDKRRGGDRSAGR